MGAFTLETPRDRNGTFEPQLIAKGQRRLDGFDQKILALYAKGMTTRDIRDIVKELYGVDVSPALVSEITADRDAEVTAWRTRLDAVWPIVYLDGIVVHVRGANGRVSQHSMYVAIGANVQGRKELLGPWLGETEGAKFGLSCLTDLKERGVEDMFIVCVDGLSGFPEAIRAALPETKVRLCIVHLVRAALKYTTETDSREVASDLETIYQSATVLGAEGALERFATKWDAKYPTIGNGPPRRPGRWSGTSGGAPGGRVMRLMTSDEYPVYEDVIRDAYGHRVTPPRTGRRGRPRNPYTTVAPEVTYATVHKERKNNRVVRVSTRVVFGTAGAVASAVSRGVNTCFVERHNGTDRNRCSRKVRKTYAFSKDWVVHRAASVFSYFSYNFCWAVRTLRVKGEGGRGQQRTPAVVAGLTDRVWTLDEWLTYSAVQHK